MGHGVDRVTLRFRSQLVCDPVWPGRASFAFESDDDEARDSSVVIGTFSRSTIARMGF
jgi:hypothetical protein